MLVGLTPTLLPFMVMLVIDIAASRAVVDIRVLMSSLVAFTYAILKQSPSLKVDRLVNQGLLYMLGVTVVALYFLVAIVLGKLFSASIAQALPLATASALFPIRQGLQALVNRLFYRS